SARSTVLQAEVSYHQLLDQFKQQLGLPTDLPVELDDETLRPLKVQLRKFEQVFDEFEMARQESGKYGDIKEVAKLRGRLRELAKTAVLVRGTNFSKEFPKHWAAWEALRKTGMRDELTALLDKYRLERREILLAKEELEKKGKTLSPAQTKRLAE